MLPHSQRHTQQYQQQRQSQNQQNHTAWDQQQQQQQHQQHPQHQQPQQQPDGRSLPPAASVQSSREYGSDNRDDLNRESYNHAVRLLSEVRARELASGGGSVTNGRGMQPQSAQYQQQPQQRARPSEAHQTSINQHQSHAQRPQQSHQYLPSRSAEPPSVQPRSVQLVTMTSDERQTPQPVQSSQQISANAHASSSRTQQSTGGYPPAVRRSAAVQVRPPAQSSGSGNRGNDWNNRASGSGPGVASSQLPVRPPTYNVYTYRPPPGQQERLQQQQQQQQSSGHQPHLQQQPTRPTEGLRQPPSQAAQPVQWTPSAPSAGYRLSPDSQVSSRQSTLPPNSTLSVPSHVNPTPVNPAAQAGTSAALGSTSPLSSLTPTPAPEEPPLEAAGPPPPPTQKTRKPIDRHFLTPEMLTGLGLRPSPSRPDRWIAPTSCDECSSRGEPCSIPPLRQPLKREYLIRAICDLCKGTKKQCSASWLAYRIDNGVLVVDPSVPRAKPGRKSITAESTPQPTGPTRPTQPAQSTRRVQPTQATQQTQPTRATQPAVQILGPDGNPIPPPPPPPPKRRGRPQQLGPDGQPLPKPPRVRVRRGPDGEPLPPRPRGRPRKDAAVAGDVGGAAGPVAGSASAAPQPNPTVPTLLSPEIRATAQLSGVSLAQIAPPVRPQALSASTQRAILASQRDIAERAIMASQGAARPLQLNGGYANGAAHLRQQTAQRLQAPHLQARPQIPPAAAQRPAVPGQRPPAAAQRPAVPGQRPPAGAQRQHVRPPLPPKAPRPQQPKPPKEPKPPRGRFHPLGPWALPHLVEPGTGGQPLWADALQRLRVAETVGIPVDKDVDRMLIKATETTQKAERVVARQQREEELARKAQRHKEEMARREVEKAQRAAERAALAALPRAPRPPREPRPPRPKAPKPPRPPKPLKEKKIKLRLCKLILPDSSSFDLKRSYAGMERRPGKKRKVAEAADAAVDVAAQAVAATAPPRVEVSASAEDAGASASPAEAEGDGAAAAPAEAEGAGPAEDAQPSVESQLERAALVAELTEAVGGPVDVVPPTDDPMAEDVGSQPISAPEAGAADDVTTDTAPLVAQDRANAASEGVGEQESAAPEAGAANIATNETAPVVAQARDDAVAEGVDDQATSAPEARAAADKTAEADPTVAQARDDTAVTPVAVTAASVTPTGETSVIEPATGAVATLDEATENDLVAQKDDTAVVELATKEDAALNEATGTPVPVDEVLDDTAPFNPASQLDAVTEAMNADVDDDSDGDSDNPDVDADLDDNGEPDETMDVDEPLADRSDEEDEEIEVGYDDEEAALNEPDAGYDVAYDGEEDEEADEEEADEVLDVDAYDDYPEVTFVADSDEDEDDDHYDGAEFTYAAESDEERAINEPLPKKRRRPRKKPRPPPAVPRRVFYGTAPTHSRPRPAKRRRIQRVYVEIVTRNPYCFPSRNTSEVEDELELEWSDNDAPRPVMITHKPPPGSAWATATRVISLARKEGYSSGYIVVEKQTVPDLTPLVVGKLHPPLNFIPLPPTPPPPRLATPAPAPSGSDFGGGEMWEPLGGADIEGVALLQDVGMSPLRSATRPGPSSPLLPVRAPRASSPLLPARSAYVTPSRPAATPAPPLPSVLTLRSLLTTPVSATSTPANAAPVPRPTPTPTQQSDALDTEFASEAANIQNSYDSELDAENARFAALLEAERQRHAQAVAALASRYKGQVERLNHEVVRTANEIDVRGSAEASVEAGPSAPTQTDAAPGA